MRGAWLWTLIGLIAVSKAGWVMSVGKPRDPITPNAAAGEVLFGFLLVLGVYHYGLRP